GEGSPLRVALCLPNTQCGIAAVGVMQQAQITPPAQAIYAQSAADTIDQVGKGHADGGLVYRTGFVVHLVAGVSLVDLDASTNARVDYQIRRGKKDGASGSFMDYIRSTDGVNRLHALGLLQS